jgi:DNA-binding transcriptional MerR regulator
VALDGAMDKSPEAFRTISEAAESMDLPQHVLRFWETRFPQIKPLKRAGGRRYYRPDDIDLLRAIKRLLYDEGYTIKGVQKMLRENGAQSLTRTPAGEAAPNRVARAEPASRPEPVLRRPEPIAPPVASRQAPTVAPISTAAPAPPVADLAILKALLGDLREAERILAQARSA